MIIVLNVLNVQNALFPNFLIMKHESNYGVQ